MKQRYTYSTPWVDKTPCETRQSRRRDNRNADKIGLFRDNARIYYRTTLDPLGDEFTCRDKADPRTGPLLAPRRYRRKVMRGQA